MLREGYTAFLVKTKLDKVTKTHQLLCIFSQEPILVSRHYISLWTKMQSSQFKISWLPRLAFLGSKTTQLFETYSRSEQTKPFGDHQDLPPTREVGYLNRFQGRLLPYTYTGTIQEIPDFTSKVGHTSSRPCHSVCPQHPWSSLGYQRRLN